MPPITVLMKPVSAACNLSCTYCFYKDVVQERAAGALAPMSLALLESIISQALSYGEGSCCFAFQGGEPTLAGLEFYRQAVQLQGRYNRKNLQISNTIQTNGMLLNDEWACFFRDQNFLVGVSLDGDCDQHNLFRKNAAGDGSFNQVLRATQLLQKYKVPFNVLSVVTGVTARHIRKTYSFFKKHNLTYLQFIPCLDPLRQERFAQPYSLSAAAYGSYLIDIFELWYADFCKGDYLSIRHIDNLVRLAAGFEPESCNQRGCCSIQFVIESDGSVYPCDFYAEDQWKLGKVQEQTFAQLGSSPNAQKFIGTSLAPPPACEACAYRRLCRNGCRRDRPAGMPAGRNVYCEAYRRFFDACADRLYAVAKIIYGDPR